MNTKRPNKHLLYTFTLCTTVVLLTVSCGSASSRPRICSESGCNNPAEEYSLTCIDHGPFDRYGNRRPDCLNVWCANHALDGEEYCAEHLHEKRRLSNSEIKKPSKSITKPSSTTPATTERIPRPVIPPTVAEEDKFENMTEEDFEDIFYDNMDIYSYIDEVEDDF